MRGGWLAILLGLLSLTNAQAGAVVPEQIRVVSDVWVDYTHADGTGLAWDIMRAVYEPVGVEVVPKSVPYLRGVGLVQRGEADAWLGSYRNEVDQGVIYPHWHYDADLVSALGLAERPAPSLESIGEARLVWPRGYEYQRYLPDLKHYRELQRDSNVLRMLDYGRTDYYINAHLEIQIMLERAEEPSRYRITPLTALQTYPGFADNPRGKALAEVYDQRMEELVREGKLRPLFKRWAQRYPFD